MCPSYATHETTERTNYDYLAAVHGDFKNRFFYTLGGSLEHYSLFGVETTPRAGFVLRAAAAQRHLQRHARPVQLWRCGARARADRPVRLALPVPVSATATSPPRSNCTSGRWLRPSARTYEGGVEQAFLSERIIFRASYFHNEFGKQIEYVGGHLLPNLIPNLTAGPAAGT